jgi:hypothetical protein
MTSAPTVEQRLAQKFVCGEQLSISSTVSVHPLVAKAERIVVRWFRSTLAKPSSTL